MDTSALTHVAAILVGVALTLVLARSLPSSNNKEAAVTAADTNASTGKKKKKKKSKAAAASAAAADDEKVPTKEAPEKEQAPLSQQQQRQQQQQNSVPAAAKSNKKKKKKNTKVAAAKTSTGSTSAATNGTDTSTQEPLKEKQQQQQQQPEVQWQQLQQQAADDEWIVEGPKKKTRKPKVAKAAAAAAAPSAAASDSVVVDAKKVGIIIGPKGATMKAIEEATGCKLDINAPSKDDPPPKMTNKPQKATVVLTGNKDAILKAKKAITELASKGYATILQSDGFGESSISVHPRCLSEIVGVGGKTIQALQTALDVKLTIPPTDWKPNSSQHQVGEVKMCKVGIAGSKENSKQTKAVLQSIVDYHHHPITHPGMIHEQVYVPSEFFHCVIGVRGSEIKHMRGNYKVDVYMPSADSFTENVLVVGKKSNVDKAITYIQTLMERDTEQREQKFSDESY